MGDCLGDCLWEQGEVTIYGIPSVHFCVAHTSQVTLFRVSHFRSCICFSHSFSLR